MANLARFHEAQQSQYSGYTQALKEIDAGKKTSHWIWYIFPQLNLKTLGQSANAQYYGIVNFEEGCDYLKDPILFQRYNKMLMLIEQHLKNEIPLNVIMGSSIDEKKLISSLTLFKYVASYLDLHKMEPKHDFPGLIQCCENIFALTANKHAPCQHTLSYLKSNEASQDTIKSVAQTLSCIDKHDTCKSHSQEKQNSSPSLFQIKSIAIKSPDASKVPAALIPDLEQYIQRRANEWSFHFNFLGIMSVVYYIQDIISGTDHFNSKSREIKISSATKLKNLLDPTCVEKNKHFTQSEINALKEGRLGALVLKHGGLEELIRNAPSGEQRPLFKI